jgi:Cdc6-like AAA superfamily ATPase
MDIDEYLQDKAKQVEKCFGRIQNPQVFDFNYIPPAPLMRAELRPVIDALVRYEKTGVANHLLIVGSRGCGKTLSLLYLRKLFQERNLKLLYVNCRVENTSYKILARLLGVRARGISFSELAERFGDAHPTRTVVLLDEIDLLSDKDKNKNILYFLTRSENNYMAVLLSNNPKWASTLDESIQSTLQAEQIYFRPYTAWELRQILGQRAKDGLESASDEVLAKISALTTKYTNSDARVALKTLYYWAVEPKTSLEDNFQKARRDLVVEVVRNLNDKSLLILRAAGAAEKPVKEVYESYRRLCRQHKEVPFSYVHFYSNLAYLQSLGLILLISTKIRRSYTKLLQLTFPEDVLDAVWRYRFA